MDLNYLIRMEQLQRNLKLLRCAVEYLELAFFPTKGSRTNYHLENAEEVINELYNI